MLIAVRQNNRAALELDVFVVAVLVIVPESELAVLTVKAEGMRFLRAHHEAGIVDLVATVGLSAVGFAGAEVLAGAVVAVGDVEHQSVHPRPGIRLDRLVLRPKAVVGAGGGKSLLGSPCVAHTVELFAADLRHVIQVVIVITPAPAALGGANEVLRSVALVAQQDRVRLVDAEVVTT